MSPAQVMVRVNVEMSLVEALELEARLNGGPSTNATQAVRAALVNQLDAVANLLQEASR